MWSRESITIDGRYRESNIQIFTNRKLNRYYPSDLLTSYLIHLKASSLLSRVLEKSKKLLFSYLDRI